MIALLSNEERTALLDALFHWRLSGDGRAITRTVRFGDFSQAFAFMTQVAMQAERIGHHPDWCNSYNRVDISLTTHDAGGLTARDGDLARAIDDLCDSAHLI